MKPESQDIFRLPAEEARACCRDAFAQLGAPEEEAETCADLLVETSLRGIDSHGIVLLPL